MNPSSQTSRPLTLALAGNPNSGKTTIFNALTGSRQHVGNYPGVTVERKQGVVRDGDRAVTIVDLPGTYSLSAYSIEERVTRNVLLDDAPDIVVHIVDAANLERNLYLAVQLIELGLPVVLALNMWDMLRDKGVRVDVDKLSQLLGVPVFPTVGHKAQGVRALLGAAVHAAGTAVATPRRVDYGNEVEPHVAALTESVVRHPALEPRARWFAMQLLENDEDAAERVTAMVPDGAEALFAEARQLRQHIESMGGDDISALLADRRYGFVAGVCAEVVSRTSEARMSHSERIDRVFLNRWLGLPIFALLMYLMFQFAFTLAEPMMGWMESLFEFLGATVSGFWPEDSTSLLKRLLVEGVISGVGQVLVFLPNILLLFLSIAILEDSGYMARAAFIMDRLMHKIGLHGKSFIPMLIGFGCTVPAIMATRTLESRRDRMTTILVLPLMSCGARLTIYALFIPAFFAPAWRAPILWLIYVIGILLAVLGAKVLRSTLFRGENVPFVMELPPYRLPTPRGLLVHMTERAWLFLKKAGTIILGFAVVLWMLTVWPSPTPSDHAPFDARVAAVGASLPAGEERDARIAAIESERDEMAIQRSVVGRVGVAIAPVFRPLGFDWRTSTALLGAFAAKEVFVAQLAIVFAVDAEDGDAPGFRERLQAHYDPLRAFAIMLFILISIPCMATVSVTYRETGAWKWAALQLFGLTALAWIITAGFYQTGRILQLWLG